MDARRTKRDDEGSILPLIAVFVAICLALVLTVTAAGSLYLDRARLYSLADGAAVAGAESFPLDRAPEQAGELPRLHDDEVAAAARDYLAAAGEGRLGEVRLTRADSPDGRSARVTLQAEWHPPIVGELLPEVVQIKVTSTARGALR